MKKTTAVQWQLFLIFHLQLINITKQSIDGVTYQNHFDFEQRYSNVRECDPLYWHPLHLPEHCAQMYEKLIRSRVAVAARTPLTIVRRRPVPNIYSLNDYEDPYQETGHECKGYLLPDDTSEDENLSMTPYEEMYHFLRQDVKKNPTAPVVRVVPSYGPIAVYKQPISKKSKNLITKIARAYADADKVKFDDEDVFFGKIDVKYPGFENEDSNKNQKKLDINDPYKYKRYR